MASRPTMFDRDWWLLRRMLEDNVKRYEKEPNLQGVRDGLLGALGYMDGLEQYRSWPEDGEPDAG